jgi:hypothetical protein
MTVSRKRSRSAPALLLVLLSLTLEPEVARAVGTEPAREDARRIRAECQPLSDSACAASGEQLVPLIYCLSARHQELTGTCRTSILTLNPGLRDRLEKEERARIAAERAAQEETDRLAREAEEARIRREREEAERLRRQTRFQACMQEMDRNPPRLWSRNVIESICREYSIRPPLSSEAEDCVTRLRRMTQARHLRDAGRRFDAEAHYVTACTNRNVEEGMRVEASCVEAKLREGEEPYLAIPRCQAPNLRCETFLRGNSHQARKKADFIRTFCLSHRPHEDTEDSRAFLQCIKDTQPRGWRFLWDHKMLVHLCRQSKDYRDCVIPRFFRLEDHIQNLSYPSSQRQQEEIHTTCHVQAVLREYDRKKEASAPACPGP